MEEVGEREKEENGSGHRRLPSRGDQRQTRGRLKDNLGQIRGMRRQHMLTERMRDAGEKS